MNKKSYELHPHFIYRQPSTDLSSFNELNHLEKKSMDEALLFFKNNRKFIEALRIASVSLYNALLSNELSSFSKKRKAKIFEGLFKYYVRSCTRPTPYGLFANVGIGNFNNEQYSSSEEEKFNMRKEISPDMEWLMKLIKQLEEDIHFVLNTDVRFNNIAYIRGSRVILHYSNKHEESVLPVSIKYNPLIEFIKEYTISFVPFKDLANQAAEKFELDKDEVKAYLFNLIQSDYIVTSIKPELRDGKFIQKLTKKLNIISGYEGLVQKLNNVEQMMNLYKHTELGVGVRIIEDIVKAMKDIVDADNFIKVDYVNEKVDTIPADSMKIFPYIGYLQELISQKNPASYWEEYKRVFEETYGNRKVALVELIDEVNGIGFPASFRNSKLPLHSNENPTTKELNTIKQSFIQDWFHQSLKHGKNEIRINDGMVTLLEEAVKDKNINFPLSREVYFTQIREDNQVKYLLNPDSGSNLVGKSASRFLNYFPEKANDFKTINSYDNENHVFAGLNIYTSQNRFNNIIVGESLFEYEINLEANSSFKANKMICIEDLLVGIENNQFYLMSKKLNKKVIPIANNMFNRMIAPEIYRFLVEIGEEVIGHVSGDYWGSLSKSAYLPRITYDDIILFPQTWNIKKRHYQHLINQDSNFNKYIQDLKLSRYVYLKDENMPDNKLLLDMHSDYFISILKQKLNSSKGSDYLTLQESGLDTESQANAFLREYIIGLKNRDFSLPKDFEKISESYLSLEKKDRLILPGDNNWLFFKFYVDPNRQDDFILGPFHEINQTLLEENLVIKAYFIRYIDKDGGFHIRYRINFRADEDLIIIMRYLNDFYRKTILESYGSKYVIDTYEPEYERYLGRNVFQKVENYFCMESYNMMNYLGDISLDKKEKLYFIVFSMNTLLRNIGLTISEQIELFDMTVTPNHFSKEFRKDKSDLLLYCNPTSQDSKFFEEYPALKEYIEKLASAIKENLVPLKKEMTSSFLLSLLHMHFNRLQGIDRELEVKVNCYTRHLLKSVLYLAEQKKETQLVGE